MQKQAKVVNSNSSFSIKSIVQILICNLMIQLTVFLAVCIVALIADIKSDLFYIFSLITFAVGNMLTGFYSARKKRRNGLIVAALFSLPTNLLIIFFSLIFNGFSFDYKLLTSTPILFIASAIGGIIAVNMKKKAKIKR